MLEFHWVDFDDPERIAQIRELFMEYQHELGIDLGFQGFEEELATLPGKYGPPKGALLLVEDDVQSVACGALRDLGHGICEMKRLYIRPRYRAVGLGRTISEKLMDRGREMGYVRIRLDTLRRLTPAVRLYESLGFAEVEAYNYNPEADIAYFERLLG